MEALGVITHVDQHTDWVLSIIYVQKANGELHLCLDPCDLNRAIHCNHHKMPMVEEVAHKFTLLHQAQHTSWILVHSPFGRYCFLCLPFGLVCSQDIFQRKMDQFLEECPGCIRITDDINVHGCTEAEHDAHLHNLMQVACKYGPHSCVQSTANACKGPSHKLLWLPIWCQWCQPRPREGWCCTCSPSTHECHWTPRVPWHGDIPQPLHPWPVHSDCSSARTPEKRCWLHLKCQLWGCFWVSQTSHHQWHHPQIFRPITACDHTSRCLTGRPWCSTSTEQ